MSVGAGRQHILRRNEGRRRNKVDAARVFNTTQIFIPETRRTTPSDFTFGTAAEETVTSVGRFFMVGCITR